MEYYSTMKRESLPSVTTWIDPEGIMLHEISQTEKGNSIVSPYGATGGGGLVAKSCPTLATPRTVCSLPCSAIHGILQASILEWVAISFSRGSSQPRK